jgi:hypothetical protein
MAVAVSVLRSELPEAAGEPAADLEPEPIPEPAEGPAIRAIPLPADVVPGGGCVETGMRVTLGPGGCAGEA